jgi:hypothetical protein
MPVSVTALWLQNPSSVLLLAPGEGGSIIPFVRRIPRAVYWRACGGQSGYNERLNAGLVLPVEFLRLDPYCPRILDIRHTWRGARYAAANPLIAIGLLMTKRETAWVERDMRELFAVRDDADEAAAIAVRSFEQWGRKTGTLTVNQ